jgi:ribonuclease BN (tRNA processing enzyme)
MRTNTVFGEPTDDAVSVDMKFLGTGSAFCLDNWQSNVLLSVTSDRDVTKHLLIDCGGDVRHALAEQELSHHHVDAVYISHPHSDHVGGLEWLAFLGRFDPSYKKPAIVGNWRVLQSVWENSIRGGLESLEGVEVGLPVYFDVTDIGENEGFIFNGLKIELLRVVHIMNNRELVPSYGLMLYMPGGEKVFFTTDTQHAPNQIGHFYDRSDLIFHDCETGYGKTDGEPNIEKPFMSGVHAHLEELADLPQDTKAKMRLYHYQDGTLNPASAWDDGKTPEATPIEQRAEALGFGGFVKKGAEWRWPR